MQIRADTSEDYIEKIPDEPKQALNTLRKIIRENLPAGFKETISYGMIGYVVPHSLYPKGYHVDPKQPLPFINIASQKNCIALYHMGLYINRELLNWFAKEYSNQSGTKPDIGNSCIRFKKYDQIPLKLVGELAAKITVKDWIRIYESQLTKLKIVV
jgi:hypothetical protein